jgi:hypothetical protein
MLDSIGRVTSLPLGRPVVGLSPPSLWTGVICSISSAGDRTVIPLWQNWLRHGTRMSNSRMPKIMLNYRPNGRRRLGRPLKRLLDETVRKVYHDLTRDGWWWWCYSYCCNIVTYFGHFSCSVLYMSTCNVNVALFVVYMQPNFLILKAHQEGMMGNACISYNAVWCETSC